MVGVVSSELSIPMIGLSVFGYLTESSESSARSRSRSSDDDSTDDSPITTDESPVKLDDEEQGRSQLDSNGPPRTAYSNRFIARVVVALLIGVFASNVDSSLVIATYPLIASEFNDLENSSWLFIGFLLAGTATQSLYGKLSDIYGRRSLLMFCYALFAVGWYVHENMNILAPFLLLTSIYQSGVGQTMAQVILGRILSGSGGAGMTALAAVIVTDIAPLRDVASWQSYINVVATIGRSIGGPLGGLLADTIGWRWSFFGQAPIFILAMIMCWMILPNIGRTRGRDDDDEQPTEKLARIDFLGAFFLGTGLLALLLPLKVAGEKVSWLRPTILILFGSGILLLLLFAITEARWAKEPIFPLRLLRTKDVVISYLITILQVAAQVGMMFTVPLYFQVTERSSNTVAGAHLMPAVIGNTVGGILTGFIIHRTGRYKSPVVLAGMVSCLSYGLMILRWNGHTNWLESLYITPGGFGTGVSGTAVFIALQSSIDPSDKAVAASGLYLAATIGSIVGMAASNMALSTVLPSHLRMRLHELGLDVIDIEKIIKQATSRVEFLDETTPRVATAIVKSYVDGLEYSHGVSLVCAIAATIAALMFKNRQL
ncbi:major facilitator superfamily domain-containing protein [Biscogniauxia mediterranea]|nr:major facilitator superfamily domain-containing protein [Biscogniauxia mediterranea]